MSVFVLIGLLSSSLLAEEKSINLREDCRKHVSSKLLYFLDVSKKTNLAVLSLKIEKENLIKSASDLKKYLEKSSSRSKLFHQKSMQKQLNVLTEQKRLMRLISENNMLSVRSTIKLKTYKKKLEEFKKEIGRIFNVKKIKKPTFGYPLQVEWKSPCPKYRDMCKLDQTIKKNLKLLAQKYKSFRSCTAYSLL